MADWQEWGSLAVSAVLVLVNRLARRRRRVRAIARYQLHARRQLVVATLLAQLPTILERKSANTREELSLPPGIYCLYLHSVWQHCHASPTCQGCNYCYISHPFPESSLNSYLCRTVDCHASRALCPTAGRSPLTGKKQNGCVASRYGQKCYPICL